MTRIRIRHIAQVNPASRRFDNLGEDSRVPFLPMERVWPDERLDLSECRSKSSVASGYTRFETGDIIVPKITPTFEASRSVLIPDLPQSVGVGTTELHVVRAGHRVDRRYLLYQFHSHLFLKVGESEMYGVAGQKRVPDDLLRDWEVVLPPLDEQRRIADFLDSEVARIDNIVRRRKDACKLLLARRSVAAMRLVLGAGKSGQFKVSGLPWASQIPVDWRAVKLSYVAVMGSGHTPSRNRPEWWIDCAIPWVTTGEVSQMRSDRLEYLMDTREKISQLGLENSSAEIHPAGTVVLCRTAASAGYSAIMAVDMATSQDIATWTCSLLLKPEYLLWCLRAMRTDLLERLAMGSTHKTIYMPDLQGLQIPLPSVKEQERIVAAIREGNEFADSAVDAIDHQLTLLADRRQALITAAVTGQIDVTTARGAAV